MSLFESFLGGAAEAGTSMLKNQMAQEQAEEQAKRMAKFQEEIAMERLKTVEALREQYDIRKEQRAQEPLNRMGSLIGSFRQQDVPMEPAKVSTLSGSGTTFDGQELQTGFSGKSPDEMRKILNAMPEGEDKVNALKQLENQIARDSATAMEAVAGETRKMTAKEAEQAALEKAMVSDPQAYAAYQRDIGAPLRSEGRADKHLALQRDQLDWTKEIQQRQLEQHAELQKIAQQRADASETKADARQRMTTLSTIMRDAAMDAKELRTRLQDPMLDATSKKVYEQQLISATQSHNLAAATLLKDSGINQPEKETPVKITEKPPAPELAIKALMANPNLLKDFEKKYGNGAVPLEFYQKAKESQSESPAEKKYNAVGYTDVQETIDGAKRGDKKALAYLESLIAQGSTTPRQRQEIAKILNGR